MGMIFTEVTFDSEPPSRESLQKRLTTATGLQVHIETLSCEDATKPDQLEAGQDWQIHFKSAADGFNGKVDLHRVGQKIHIQEPADGLNRCPNYLLYAVEASLIYLGGTVKNPSGSNAPRKVIPEYGLGTFEQWKKSNHGTRPPAWKVLLAMTGMMVYVIIVGVAFILMLPILLGIVLFFWLKERRRTA